MKITSEHFLHMKSAIDQVLAIHNADGQLVRAYETGNFPLADRVQDLQKRFCFDLFYLAGLTTFACDNLYSYVDDTHIFTALKQICPAVVRAY